MRHPDTIIVVPFTSFLHGLLILNKFKLWYLRVYEQIPNGFESEKGGYASQESNAIIKIY